MSIDVSTDLSAIDELLMDPDWYGSLDYLSAFKELRDSDPVRLVNASNYGRPFWVVSKYEDVKWGLQNSQLLSNREGARMPRVPSRTTAERRMEMGYDTRLDYLDDPLHSVYRRPLNKHFSVPAVKRLGTDIASYVNEIIDKIDDNVDFNFVDDVAAALPVMVVGRLLGVPREEWDYLQLTASRVIESHDARFMVDNDPLTTFRNAYQELLEYGERLVADRRANPKDDFATILSQMKADHELLSPREARQVVVALILGGFDTTRHALSVGTWQLLSNPSQRQAILDDPSLVMGAVDESIRFASPARSLTRVANEDFDLRDKRIRSGDWVSLLVISANRDETQFERPLEFDVTRTSNEYLSFGEGIHKCLGRNLIRLELAACYPILFSRMPELRLTGEPRWLRDTAVSGFANVPLHSGKIVRT
ncbi:cytochrome P450 [Rhodococcoides yunnanense]|uniref:cytochrome P450 n=1 Tax=Rhodococcoides yunnanense TaxID=278209 RepID=UPI00093314DD|nr:cytochrome P450 [Rhodococcus yunnanensis]